jgi:hypothetical protein
MTVMGTCRKRSTIIPLHTEFPSPIPQAPPPHPPPSWNKIKLRRPRLMIAEGPERGGPLPTVETEVTGDWGVQMKGVPPWLVHLACRAGTRDFCSALAALVSRDKLFFSSRHTISMNVSPTPSNPGRQSCRAAFLWMCVVSLGLRVRTPFYQ